MISPIQLTPNMDLATLATAVNETFRQIEAENRTKVIKDEQGNNRILIGRAPNGSYGVYIVKPGFDVIKELGG